MKLGISGKSISMRFNQEEIVSISDTLHRTYVQGLIPLDVEIKFPLFVGDHNVAEEDTVEKRIGRLRHHLIDCFKYHNTGLCFLGTSVHYRWNDFPVWHRKKDAELYKIVISDYNYNEIIFDSTSLMYFIKAILHPFRPDYDGQETSNIYKPIHLNKDELCPIVKEWAIRFRSNLDTARMRKLI